MKNEKKLHRFFNFTFRYIDDVFSLNNCKFGNFVDRIYPTELEIKDTTDTTRGEVQVYIPKGFIKEGSPGIYTCNSLPDKTPGYIYLDFHP